MIEVFRPGGYLTIFDPDPPKGQASTQEWDTLTCGHCSRVARVKPGTKVDEYVTRCKQCMKHICPLCTSLSCDPVEKKLERAEAAGKWLTS